MRKELELLGRREADTVLADTYEGSGTCEECGIFGAMYWGGCGSQCRKCLAESVEYWETRGGHSSEQIFYLFPHMPAESSRVYRVAMGAYFAHLRGGDNDGNPFTESDPYEEGGE